MQMTLREKAEMVIGHLSAMQKVNPMNPMRYANLTLHIPVWVCPLVGVRGWVYLLLFAAMVPTD